MSVSLEEMCHLVNVNYTEAIRARARPVVESDSDPSDEEDGGSSYHPSSESEDGDGPAVEGGEEFEADTGRLNCVNQELILQCLMSD